MKKISLDIIDDILTMVDDKCPKYVFEELTDFQCECQKMDSCFECWHRTVAIYQNEHFLKSMNEHFLKSMNDNEKRSDK
jgi:hypothetical protein